MTRDPVKDAEIEVVCPGCGYHMARTANRLRRSTHLVCPECGEEIAPDVPDTSRSG